MEQMCANKKGEDLTLDKVKETEFFLLSDSLRYKVVGETSK